MTDPENSPSAAVTISSQDASGHQEHDNQENEEPKEIIATKVTGTVKWFNVKSGYGFINRNDTKEDVFVHQTAIVKNNPKKAVRSVGDGELVEFDVVVGEKGNEAANVTGPDGDEVRGSPFAADGGRYRSYYPRSRGRGYPRRYRSSYRGRGPPRFRGGKGSAPSDQVDEDSGDQEESPQNDRGKPDAQYTNGYGRGSRGGRGRGFRGYRPRYIRRGGFRPQKPGGNPEEDAGPVEGAPRGRGRGRGFRGGFRGGFSRGRGGFRGGRGGFSRGGGGFVPRGRGRGRGGRGGGRGRGRGANMGMNGESSA